jgi:hypothetical protein
MAPSCDLDEAGLRLRLDRYRRAGRGASLVVRTSRRLIRRRPAPMRAPGHAADPQAVGIAIRLLKLADPFATATLHWTLKTVGDVVVVVTACSEAGIAASAGSVFVAA